MARPQNHISAVTASVVWRRAEEIMPFTFNPKKIFQSVSEEGEKNKQTSQSLNTKPFWTQRTDNKIMKVVSALTNRP